MILAHTQSERVSCIGQEAVFLTQDVESVELVEQLHERTLDLAVGRGALRETPAADRVDLIHKDDTRLVVTRVAVKREAFTRVRDRRKSPEKGHSVSNIHRSHP